MKQWILYSKTYLCKLTYFSLPKHGFRLHRSLSTTWSQIHNFGINVERSSRGQLGISLLINPLFPYTVLPLPVYQDSNYILPCQCQTYLIICTYLPPTLDDQFSFDLLTDSLEHYYANNYEFEHLLLCGDFNTRLGDYVGDKRQNSRYHLFFEFLQAHSLTLLHNADHAFRVPTYIKGTEANPTDKTSIIDFFLTTHPSDMTGISMNINTETYLGSDYKIFYFELPHYFNEPPITNTHPRILWNINKFKPSKRQPTRHLGFILKYCDSITPSLNNFSELVDPIFLSSIPDHHSKQEYIDEMNTKLISIIHSSLDATIKRKIPRPRTWKWFYTQHLADACHKRESLYKKWKHANYINKILYWKQFQEAADIVKSLVQKNKHHYFKNFVKNSPRLNLAKHLISSKTLSVVRLMYLVMYFNILMVVKLGSTQSPHHGKIRMMVSISILILNRYQLRCPLVTRVLILLSYLTSTMLHMPLNVYQQAKHQGLIISNLKC